jgi:hypothetical protein
LVCAAFLGMYGGRGSASADAGRFIGGLAYAASPTW